MPQSGCFIIQLPRRVLRVYWLGYLPGSVLQERAAGASSLVCTGLNMAKIYERLLSTNILREKRRHSLVPQRVTLLGKDGICMVNLLETPRVIVFFFFIT